MAQASPELRRFLLPLPVRSGRARVRARAGLRDTTWRIRARTRTTFSRWSRSTAIPSQVVSLGGVIKGKLVASLPIAPTWFSGGGKFVLGADGPNGRDEAVRLLYGGRNSLLVGIGSSAICVFFAVVLALLAGYFRGWTDFIITRFFDLFYAFPVVLLGIALGSRALDQRVPPFRRSTCSRAASGSRRSSSPTCSSRTSAARCAGRCCRCARRSSSRPRSPRVRARCGSCSASCCRTWRDSVLVFFTLIIANNIVLEAALSFLGAGVQPPNPSWGTLISTAGTSSSRAPWLVARAGHRDRAHRPVAERVR